MSQQDAPAPPPPVRPTAVTPNCILGECNVALTHHTTYEPPLYLFPELLTKVPQGTPPLTAWDAVADAVDVPASYWRIAEVGSILAETGTAAQEGKPTTTAASPYGTTAAGSHALSTLAAMLGANRLLPAGLTPSTLQEGNFSAASVIAELTKLQKRTGVLPTDDGDDGATHSSSSSSPQAPSMEGALLMSNHFVNLLAWRKLKEINDDGIAEKRTKSSSVATATAASDTATTARGGKRRREVSEDNDDGERSYSDNEGDSADVLDHLMASPDPWSRDVDERRFAGKFISGRDANAERRVKLLETLSELYGRPWKRMHSQGVQTDHVVPRGVMNASSPYVDPFQAAVVGKPGAASGAAELDAEADLGWGGAEATEKAVVLSPSQAGYGVIISPVHDRADAGGAAATSATCAPDGCSNSNRFMLTAGTTYFGRVAGAQSDPRTGPVCVDVGLAAYAEDQEAAAAKLSALHFALILKPQYGEEAGNQQSPPREESGEAEEENGEDAPRRQQHLHHKTPTGYALYLANYGRNGVRVCDGAGDSQRTATPSSRAGKGQRHRWVLGDLVRLAPGSEITVADAVVLRVVSASDDDGGVSGTAHASSSPVAAAAAAVVKREGSAALAEASVPQSLSQVKQEREED